MTELLHIPFEDYQALPHDNYTRLKLMAKSPAHYKANQRTRTSYLDDGRLIHMAALEPDAFEDRVHIWRGGMTKTGRPTTNKNSQAFKDFEAEAKKVGGIILEEWERDRYLTIADSIAKKVPAGMLDGEHEVTVIWKHRYGRTCKSRLDSAGGWLVDLKSTADAHPRKFGWDAFKYLYHAQAAFYSDAWFAHTGERPPFAIVAVEKSKPYDVVTYRVPDEAIDAGRYLYEQWIQDLIVAEQEDHWPGYDSGFGILDLELPERAYENLSDLTTYVDGVRMQGDPSAL